MLYMQHISLYLYFGLKNNCLKVVFVLVQAFCRVYVKIRNTFENFESIKDF